MQTASPPTAPPMTAPKLEADSDFASGITGGIDTGVVVTRRAASTVTYIVLVELLPDCRSGSRIAAAGMPAATSAELRLLAVILVDIATAVVAFGAFILVSTRMPVANRRLSTGGLMVTSTMRSMLTSPLDTPAVRATDSLNLSCSLLLKFCLVRGSDTAKITTYPVG